MIRFGDCELRAYSSFNGALQRHMITVGSVTRDAAAQRFPFLALKYSGRRAAIKEFTHRDPDFVYWIYPDGRLHDARDSHAKNEPRGYEHIVNDEPDYGGFLRGRVASLLTTSWLLSIAVKTRFPFQEKGSLSS